MYIDSMHLQHPPSFNVTCLRGSVAADLTLMPHYWLLHALPWQTLCRWS